MVVGVGGVFIIMIGNSVIYLGKLRDKRSWDIGVEFFRCDIKFNKVVVILCVVDGGY